MNPLLLVRELASDVLVERLGWVLVHSLWQFTLIAYAAALAVRLLGRSRAAARYAALVGAMAVIVASPVATWCLQPEGAAIAEVAPDVAEAPIATAVAPAIARMNALRDEPADAALAVNLPAEELPAKPALLAIPEVPVAAPAPLSWAEAVELTLRPWLAWIVVGWSLGVVLCSLRPLLGWHALWRLRRVGVSPVGDEISAALRRVAGQLGLRRAVQVLQSTLVQTPVLVGYFRPAILLPVGLATGLPIAQLEAILAHELAHVRRHDFVVNLLQTLVETLCFYHPAVWWLSRQIRVEREHCCDDLVVGLLGNRVEYGRALLAVEELRGTSSVLALGMADGVLLSRVRRLFGGDRAAARLTDRWPAALLSLAGVGFVLVLGLVWHRAAQDDGDQPSQPAIATLPGDITVELVGVSFYPSKDKAWWKADGSPIERPRGLRRGGGEMIPASDRYRGFLLEVRGLTPEQSLATEFLASGGGATFNFEGLRRHEHAAGPFQSPTTTVKVRVATDPFGPTLTIDKNGIPVGGAEIPNELKALYARFVPKQVATFGGSTDLVVQNNGEKDQQISDVARVDLVAIDLDGQRHQPNSYGVRVGEWRWGFTGLLPDRIDHFEYRLRPYRHFVTFENISLEPGRKTEVKVSVESLPQPAIAKLPGDIAVELVGVGSHPSKDKPWWKPNGSPLEPRPTLEGGFSVMSGSPEQAQCREFLIHIRGLPREHAVTTDYGSVAAATGSSYSNGLWVGEHGAGPFKSDTTSVRVGLTTEPYGPTVEIDITGTRQPAELSADLQPFYDRIVSLRVEEVDGQTELILDGKASNNLFKEAAWELHAVDVDGAKHRRSAESVPRSGERHFTFKLPRNRIARFEYRVRPYRHWATFENISLEPGMKTEVEVSTESLPASKPERYSATLPDGVKVSFVGMTKNTAPARTGWRPDGLPLGDVPEWPAGWAIFRGAVITQRIPESTQPDETGRDLLFEFRGLRREPSLKLVAPFKTSGFPTLALSEPSRLRISGALRAEFKPGEQNGNSPSDEVRLGITDEPWGKWVQVSSAGEILNPLEPSDVYRATYALLEPRRVEQTEKHPRQFSLVHSRPVGIDQICDIEVRAIDSAGAVLRVIEGRSWAFGRSGFVNTDWELVNPLDSGKQLARFEYRLRPYRHWVTFKGVSLEAGKESDVKVSVETVQATADFPRPRPEDVRGLDLSRAAVRHYSEATRLSPEQQTPELQVPGSDPAEPWRRPKNVFLMPLAENIWLKYPAGSGHFYINHRPDGTWQHERMYGPIEGDPFELLKLEELFREQLKPGATGGDPRYRLTLMFRTGEPELVRRAWRLIEPKLIVETTGPDTRVPVAGSAVRYTEQDPWRFERIESLGRVREALRDEAEAFRRPELTDVVARMREIVAAAEAAIDATNDAVADAAYESVTYLQPGLKAKIPAALWGPPLNGLRLGLVPSDGIDWSKWQQLPTDKPLPTHITALPGEELQYLLVVENVSDREIKLSGYVVGQEMARGLEMLDQNGRPVDIENLHASTLHIRSYWRLKPGERQLLTMPAVNLTSAPVDPAERRLGYSVKAVPGHHTLRCTIRFGNLDNERHRYVPGKSEWIGELSTGTQKITVVERVLDAARGENRGRLIDFATGKPVASATVAQGVPANTIEPKAVLTTKPGTWILDDETSFEITSKVVHAADYLTEGVFRRRAVGQRAAVDRKISIAADAFGLREKWIAGWTTGSPVVWVLTESFAPRRVILRRLPFDGVENSLELSADQPIGGLGMPDVVAREFARRYPSVGTFSSRLPPFDRDVDEAAQFIEKLQTILPPGWKVYRQGRAFEFRGPRGLTAGTQDDEARITFWFSERFADSTVLNGRDPKLPRIGSWGITRLGQVLFTRNPSAIESWPTFLDDVYWVLPVEHVAFVGQIDVDQEIDGPHSLGTVMSDAGTRIDVRIDESGNRIDHIASDGFRAKVQDLGIARETQLVVTGYLPKEELAATDEERQSVKRRRAWLDQVARSPAAYGTRIVRLPEYIAHLKQLKRDGLANPLPAVKDGNSIEVPVVAVPPVERGAGVPVSADRPLGLSARDDNKPAQRLGTLTGRFVYDGEAPPRKDVWPQFAEIDATQRQQPGPDGRFSGVEATYREFLKQNIRPSTLDSSLMVDNAGGIANVVIWVTSKEIPWTPPADLAQRPVTIRLKDGNFSPRMTVAMVGQPVVVENLDPVPSNFHAEFSRALNSPVNMLMPARSDEQPPPISFRAAEPYPSRFRSDLGPWAGGLLMIHGNPYVAVSQADGSFTLPDLPPGEWEFRVWHERRGYVQKWPKGVFRQTIEAGQNDLGVIRLKPELFAER